jgi:hypothetical protein
MIQTTPTNGTFKKSSLNRLRAALTASKPASTAPHTATFENVQQNTEHQ